MKKIRFILVLAMFIGALTAMAQSTETPVVDQRQRNQRARIREGAASGELTRQEAVKARHDQRQVRRTERRAKADGDVTNRERARIQHKQNKASRSLRRNKHDDQQQPGAN
jgi:uncharacterized membrane protein YebE (DUF533 family)